MKKVVTVTLGSSKQDFSFETQFLGQRFTVPADDDTARPGTGQGEPPRSAAARGRESHGDLSPHRKPAPKPTIKLNRPFHNIPAY